MWTSVQRRLTTAASMPSARTPWSHTNVSASQAIKGTANIAKVKVLLDSCARFTCGWRHKLLLPSVGAQGGFLQYTEVKATFLMLICLISLNTSPWASDRLDKSFCLTQLNSLVSRLTWGGRRDEGESGGRRKGKARCRVLLCDKMKWSSKFPTHVRGEN